MNMDFMNVFMDVCALLFVAAAIYYLVKWLQIVFLMRKKNICTGEVVHMELRQKNKKEEYDVEYQYIAGDGKKYSRTFHATRPEEIQLGGEVKVSYDPANPAKSYTDIEEKMARKIVIFCIITVALCGVLSLFY